MTEQKYRLYAIKTVDLPKDGLKAFEFSLCANERYALVYCDRTLGEPFRELPEDIPLEDDEKKWKEECERTILGEKIKKNVECMQEHESEYSQLLNSFFDKLEEELKKEQGENNDGKTKK